MTTALLILDVQTGNVSKLPPTISPAYLSLLSHTISSARSHSIKIIFITTSFRPSYPEISPGNKIFSKLLNPNKTTYVENTPETSILPSCGFDAEKGDIEVVKKRISGFKGSDLDYLLRGMGVRNVVIAGLVTSGAVLGTAFEASDRDFGVTVLRDLCWDRDEVVSEVLLGSVLTKVGRVMGAEEWVEGLV